MLNAFGNNEHLSGGNLNRAIAKIDPQITLDHDECLIGVLVVVPNEVALQLDDLELVIIHLGDDFRCPLLSKESQFLPEID
jgi:hypothetical protein